MFAHGRPLGSRKLSAHRFKVITFLYNFWIECLSFNMNLKNIRFLASAFVMALFYSSGCLANGFLPVMVSANVLWLFLLPTVVLIEGFFLKRWGWAKPYKSSLLANLVSTVVGIPLGFFLNMLGIAFGKEHSFDYPDINIDSTYWVDQIFVVGKPDLPSLFPAFGDPFYSLFYAGAIIFIVCYLPVTILVEGWYLKKHVHGIDRKEFWKKITSVHIVSYLFLASLWFPLAYFDAQRAEEDSKMICSQPPAGNKYCQKIWEKYPDLKDMRLQKCEALEISQDECFRM